MIEEVAVEDKGESFTERGGYRFESRDRVLRAWEGLFEGIERERVLRAWEGLLKGIERERVLRANRRVVRGDKKK